MNEIKRDGYCGSVEALRAMEKIGPDRNHIDLSAPGKKI
jgi:hypothetical protein